MQRLLRKFFGIYPGEEINTIFFMLLAITWSWGIFIADTISISLFIEKVGYASLPYSYLISGIGMIASSSLIIYFLRVTSPYKVLISTLALAFLVYGVSALVLASNAPPAWFWLFLQVATYVLIAASTSCFWNFLDQYHDLQDAKRIFGFYTAAYFLGSMLAGSTVSLCFDYFGNSGLMTITASFMIISIFLARIINNRVFCVEDDVIDSIFPKKDLFSLVRSFLNSPYALLLVAVSLTIQLLRTTTEFSYLETFSLSISTSEATIAEFLGKVKAFIAGGNIIISMLFYRRFIRKIGLPNMILIPPLLFVALYSEWLFSTTLLIAVLGMIAVEVVIYNLEDNNFNLLMNAAPLQLKGVLRIINDSLFEPLGMLVCSLFLISAQAGNKMFGFILSFTFLIASFLIRSSYFKSLFTNLKQNAIHFERKLQDWISQMNKKEQKDLKGDLLKVLFSTNESLSLAAFDGLITILDSQILPRLISQADRYSENGKIAVLRLFSQSAFASDRRVIEMVNRWATSNMSEYSKWSTLYLAKEGLLHTEKAIEDLDKPDLLSRASAITSLKKSIASHLPVGAGLNQTIASKELDLMLSSSDIEEICMGLEILENVGANPAERAIKFFSHESLKVRQNAAKTVAKVANKNSSQLASKLIEQLQYASDNEIRLNCLLALSNIGDSSTVKDIILSSIFFRPNERRSAEKAIIKMGLKTVPILLSITKDTHLHERCRILAGKILGKLALPQLQTNLMEIIDIEIEEAYFYFYHSHTLKKNNPDYDLSLLEDALFTGYKSIVDFIIHLLGAAGSIEESDLLVHILRGKNAKSHAYAIEILEKNCHPKIFKQIMPLIADMPPEEKLDIYSSMYGKKTELSLPELLTKLQKSPSFFDKMVATHLKAKLKLPNWKQSLREQIKTTDGPFHHYAYELLEEV